MKPLTYQESEWLESYLNGTISSEAFEQLQDRMEGCPELRKRMRCYLSLDYQLQEFGSDLENVPSIQNGVVEPDALFVSSVSGEIRSRRKRSTLLIASWAVAATSMVALIVSSLLRSAPDKPLIVAELVESDGLVHWTGVDGNVTEVQGAGFSFGRGTLETMSSSAWAKGVYPDGTEWTLSGNSRLTLYDSRQKILQLHQGDFTANVKPQPLESPMKIRTPSANLSVIGSQFSVRSERALTRLSVENGRVLMARSSDSREIEVAENRQALARIDEVGEWVANPLEGGNQSSRANRAEDRLEDIWLSSRIEIHDVFRNAVEVGEISIKDALRYESALAVVSMHPHEAAAAAEMVKDPADFLVGAPVYSGPQPGEQLRGFSVIPPTASIIDDSFDPVALGLGKPHIIIFIDDSDIGEGFHAFARAVEAIGKRSRTGLAASVVILARERENAKYEDYKPNWRYLNSVYRIGYAPEGRDGPGAYGLNRNLPMTILIADAEGKVLYNFPFREIPPDRPDPHVMGGLTDAIGENLYTVADWLDMDKLRTYTEIFKQISEKESDPRQ
ncbi:MAG TPA: hypothetical protein EYQ32_14480 [Gammaproteobacteria bacterium]|nr:hypothetical protein [Gammaproteobacteria bacterium]HIL18142.1 hypothetical protein [Gammaproteobacteria bacterium]